jgi:hypothetical protein
MEGKALSSDPDPAGQGRDRQGGDNEQRDLVMERGDVAQCHSSRHEQQHPFKNQEFIPCVYLVRVTSGGPARQEIRPWSEPGDARAFLRYTLV